MVGFLEVEELEKNFQQCRLYTRVYARTFYFASHVLPRPKRLAAYAIYAFCRYADNLIDDAAFIENPAAALQRLSGLRDQLRYVYMRSPLMDQKLLAFRETVFTYQIPQEYFIDLLRGVEMDLTKSRYADFQELESYCYCVASVVGLIMTKIFGSSSPDASLHAIELGIAMQLTNILRDIREDYGRGRVYLPAAEMASHSYSEHDIALHVVDDRFRQLMAHQIDRARKYYSHGAKGIPLLSNDGSRFCVRLMSRTYAGILDAIEAAGYDVFSHRAYVPAVKKLLIAAGESVPFLKSTRGRFVVQPSAPTSETEFADVPLYKTTLTVLR